MKKFVCNRWKNENKTKEGVNAINSVKMENHVGLIPKIETVFCKTSDVPTATDNGTKNSRSRKRKKPQYLEIKWGSSRLRRKKDNIPQKPAARSNANISKGTTTLSQSKPVEQNNGRQRKITDSTHKSTSYDISKYCSRKKLNAHTNLQLAIQKSMQGPTSDFSGAKWRLLAESLREECSMESRLEMLKPINPVREIKVEPQTGAFPESVPEKKNFNVERVVQPIIQHKINVPAKVVANNRPATTTATSTSVTTVVRQIAAPAFSPSMMYTMQAPTHRINVIKTSLVKKKPTMASPKHVSERKLKLEKRNSPKKKCGRPLPTFVRIPIPQITGQMNAPPNPPQTVRNERCKLPNNMNLKHEIARSMGVPACSFVLRPIPMLQSERTTVYLGQYKEPNRQIIE